jgi:hypothetical protein
MAYKAKSITSKASSACKMNMGLVQGAADVAASKKFIDHGKGVAEKFSGGQSTPAGGSDTSKDSEKKPEEKTEEKKGQADAAITVDATETPKV